LTEIEGKSVPATLVDISGSGIKLSLTEKFDYSNKFYNYKFRTSLNQIFEVMLLYLKEGFISDELVVYTSGAVLKTSITTEEIKEIIHFYHNKIEIEHQILIDSSII